MTLLVSLTAFELAPHANMLDVTLSTHSKATKAFAQSHSDLYAKRCMAIAANLVIASKLLTCPPAFRLHLV